MHTNPRERQAYMRQYAQSEAGKAARARARRNYINKRREMGAKPATLHINPDPLAQVIQHWRTQ